jgi:DNA polymerase III subunit alpha
MLARGDAVGVFQFESSGMRDALREVRPTELADLIALVALYRPGPMAYISTYAKNKRDPKRVTFDDPRLEPITGPTYGVAIYQEQLMAIARTIAGFSPSAADDLRKAVSKKNKELMASLKGEFIDGAKANGTDPKVAQGLWGLCEAAGDYSFNKSHAACYALLAYRTAWLKANHPAEYMASLLSSVMDTKDRVPFYVAACQEMGLDVLPPDVNQSGSDFRVTGEREIRFGLTAVKGVGENAVASIVAARELDGAYTSLWDFCRRVDQAQVNKRALESLIRAGALDSTGASRQGMLAALPTAMSLASRRRLDAAAGQESLFGMLDAAAAAIELDPPITAAEMPHDELLACEKEALGLYVSSHPLKDCRAQLARAVSCRLSGVADRADGETVTVGGLIGTIKNVTTRRGEAMMFARLDDLEGAVEVVVVPAVLTEARELLQLDALVLVTGRVDQKGEGETKIVAQAVRPFQPTAGGEEERLVLRVESSRLEPHLADLRRLIVDHRGPAPVVLEMECHDGRRRVRLGEEYRVDPRDSSLVASLKTLFGERCLSR